MLQVPLGAAMPYLEGAVWAAAEARRRAALSRGLRRAEQAALIFVSTETNEEKVYSFRQLHAEVQKALALPEVQAKFAPQGVEPLPLSPQEFDALIAKEIVSNVKLAQAAGLKFN